MQGRQYQASTTSSYRYSINGQEKESDINENITTALYWEYDSRIGRRWNVDPVVKEGESPYLCFSGNPILMSDVLGNDANDWVKDKSGKWLWKDEIKTQEQALSAGYADFKVPGSVVDNPGYNKADEKTGIADGNKKLLLGNKGVIFVGVLGLNAKSNSNPSIDDGHAWIGIYDVEVKETIATYGLWADNHPLAKDKSSKNSDIRMDIEKERGDKPTSAYYIGITKEQQDLFYLRVKENVTWDRTYTCANWARDCLYIITKVYSSTVELSMGQKAGTPRALDKSLYNSYNVTGVNLYPENRGAKSDGSLW